MTARRGVIVVTALAAGVSFANLTVALPLVVLARGGRPSLAGLLLAANILAYSLGALLAFASPRPEAALAAAMAALAAGGLACGLGPGLAGPAIGGVAQGAGMGLFWVGAQSALGRRAGEPGSAAAFAGQYALYILGTIAGAILTGAAIGSLRLAGVGGEASIRLSFLVGAVSSLAGLAPLLARACERPALTQPSRASLPLPLHGFLLQLPDFLLVAGLSALGTLAPVVLRHDFRLSPSLVAVAATATAAAKAAGSLTAARLVRRLGNRRTVGSMLAASAACAWLLVAVDRVWLFIPLLAVTIFLGAGAWPVCVDGALARVSPSERSLLAVSWNLREPGAMAISTLAGGYLLDVDGGRALLLALAGGLFAAAAMATLAVFRRPIRAPEVA